MKMKRNLHYTSAVKLIRNIFSIIGMVSVFAMMISWARPEKTSRTLVEKPLLPSPDMNIAKAECINFINAYRDRYFKGEENAPKGYFISRATINWLLENETNTGIYVYPALNNEGVFCTIVEGGVSTVAQFRVVEGVEGRQIISESMCPTDCGNLMR